jgi:ketosteroid isomerase-like protein
VFWTPDGSFIDDSGLIFVGHEALEKNFASSFTGTDHPQIKISVETLRMPAPNVATVAGTVKRIDANGQFAPLSRYSMTLIRQSGDWLISSATETTISADGTTQDQPSPLTELDWLIGEWQSEHDGDSVTMKADWAPGKNFIECKYEIKSPHFPVRTEKHVIGWDARHAQPISWNFDSDGGFGQGNWIRRGKQWCVESTGYGRDGSVMTAVDIYELSDKNNFSWSSTSRDVDGFPVADTITLQVKRLSN